MGLNMCAVRRTHVKQWDHEPLDSQYSVIVMQGGKPAKGILSDRITYIEEELISWYKAYHIHDWFLRGAHVPNNDYGTLRIETDELWRLYNVCDHVLERSKLAKRRGVLGIKDTRVAHMFLPLPPSCLKHGYTYDEAYLDDVQRTKDWAGRTLAEIEAGNYEEIVYSWS